MMILRYSCQSYYRFLSFFVFLSVFFFISSEQNHLVSVGLATDPLDSLKSLKIVFLKIVIYLCHNTQKVSKS